MARDVPLRLEPGNWVTVSGFHPGVETRLHFVPDPEVDYRQHRFPSSGREAEALAGASVGDKVRLDIEGKTVEVTIVDSGAEPGGG